MARATQEQSPITNVLGLLEQRAAFLRTAREAGITVGALLSVIDEQIDEHINEKEHPKMRRIIEEASENTGIPMEIEDVVYNS